jgi:hypothetical protein
LLGCDKGENVIKKKLLLVGALMASVGMQVHAQDRPTASHVFTVVAGVDARGWVGPRISTVDSLFGVTPATTVGTLYGGARLAATYLGFNYTYGLYAGASIQINAEAYTQNLVMDDPASFTLGVRRAHGWVDPLGLAGVNQQVGLKITAGYLHFEGWAGLNLPTWEGGPATSFEMGTSSVMSRAYQLDQLAIRLDMPVNAIRAFRLNFGMVTDLDFSRVNKGWSILGEVTASSIRFGTVATMGINAHYHHWQAGEKGTSVESGATWGSEFRGQGFYGSNLVGGSANIRFFLPERITLTLGFMGDYKWYFGNYRIQRKLEDFNMNDENGNDAVGGVYFGERQGSFAFEAGLNVTYPDWFTWNVAWIARANGSYGFSHDEGVVGVKPNGFISTRIDLHMINYFTGGMLDLTPYAGLSVGVTEARVGFWDQVGRVGYEVGLAYRPMPKVLIRTGWHSGSSFVGTVAAPGPRTRDGQFYLRIQWAMNTY